MSLILKFYSCWFEGCIVSRCRFFGTDLEATYGEYDEWSETGVPEPLTHQYKKALQQLAQRRPFEETLVPV